jgi:tellurite resistance protein TerC
VEIGALGWALTIGVIITLLVLDLAIGIARPHAVGFTEAAAWSIFYVAVAVAFGLILASEAGWEFGEEYFAGYIVEKSLSVDNLFVFVIIMATFATPREYQKEALGFGIVLALIVRALFIAVGAALLASFSFMFLVFGLILFWTAIQLFRKRSDEVDIEHNLLVRLVRRILPVSKHYAGGRLVTRINGRRFVTPLFLVLVAIGATDILFALDSIPAVFGVTDEPYIVFTANAFALLGLRALYFLVGGLLDRLVYLSTGLAIILGFIGVKLVLHWAHHVDPRIYSIPTSISLTVIGAILVLTTVASIIKTQRNPAARIHPQTQARSSL